MNTSMKPVTCHKCGWNHFGVDRSYAEHQAQEFLDWWSIQPAEVKECYGETQSTVELMYSYEHCFRCGNDYRNLVVEDAFTCQRGSTIQPIIFPDQ